MSWWRCICRLLQLAELHSRLLSERHVDGQPTSALLRDVRAAVLASCIGDSDAARELFVLLDRAADLLDRRGHTTQDVIFHVRLLDPA